MEDLIQVRQNGEDTVIKCSKEVKSIYFIERKIITIYLFKKMKARVKATGEIIEVNKVTSYSKDFEVLVYYKGDDGFPYKEEQLDFEDLTQGKADVKEKSLPKDEPDYWEKLKHQYAGMAMQGLLGSGNPYNGIIPDQIASDSYKYATALVNKLKEKSQCEK